jgi:FkbM family methyltransferase
VSSEFKYFKKNNIKLTGVIHVGAHRGEEIHQYEDLGVKQVIWVEPNPEIFKEMEVFLNDASASVESSAFEYAASNSDHEEVDFHLYYGPDAGWLVGNKGCSSLLKAKGRFESWHKETIKVETITIDTLIEENEYTISDFQLLNLDVQGAELMALEGASNTLDNVNYISTEATWDNPDYIGNVMYDELKAFLESKGFREEEIINHGPDWGDALFVRD